MTMQNGCKDATTAYLWADTAYWLMATGDLAFHDTKAFHSTTWPWAASLTTWGEVSPMQLMGDISYSDTKDLDSLLASSVDALRGFVRDGGGGRILVASFEDKPRLHMIACHEVFPGSGYGAFEPIEVEHFTSSANETEAYRQAAGDMTPQAMRRVIDAQCDTAFVGQGPLAKLGPRVWVGGNIVRVEVGADGVKTASERVV